MAGEQASELETYRSRWGGTAGRALGLPLRGRMEDAEAEAAFRVWGLSGLSQGPREVGGGGGAGPSDLNQTNKLLPPVRPRWLQRPC